MAQPDHRGSPAGCSCQASAGAASCSYTGLGAAAAAAAGISGSPAAALHGSSAASRPARGLERDHPRREARGDPHAGEPLLRPLLRDAPRGAGVRRQAGPHLPERDQRLPAARPGTHRPRRTCSPTPSPTRSTATSTTAGSATTAWNGGLWNNWVPAKTEETMGYFTRDEIPFQYALADAFTICDGYHQAIMAPTSPNRMYFWTGTSTRLDQQPGRLHGRLRARRRDGRGHDLPRAAADRRGQLAGLHQRPGGRRRQLPDGWLGDYGDNPLWFYQQYHDHATADHGGTGAGSPSQRCGHAWKPDAGAAAGPDPRRLRAGPVHRRLSRAGKLPQVSWIVAPYGLLRAPGGYSPDYGAHYVNTVLAGAVCEPRPVADHGAVHHLRRARRVLRPRSSRPSRGERRRRVHRRAADRPRDPRADDSSARRGPAAATWTPTSTTTPRCSGSWRPGPGCKPANITAWRRVGDRRPDHRVRLQRTRTSRSREHPDARPDLGADPARPADRRHPRPRAPRMPAQEPGTRPHRPTNYQLHADVTVNRTTSQVTAALTNTGKVGVSLRPSTPTRYLPLRRHAVHGAPVRARLLHLGRGADRREVRLLGLRP